MSWVEGDPVDWSLEEVVGFLCHTEHAPWSQSSTKSPRPDPIFLEASLRENLITGEVLLNDVDKETLREDLGLKALGHRSSLLMAIRFLRRNSRKYQELRANRNSPFDDRSLYTPSAINSTPRPIHEVSSPITRNPLSRAATPQHGTFGGPNLQSNHEISSVNGNPGDKHSGISTESHTDTAVQSRNPIQEKKGELGDPKTRSRLGEHCIVDDKGKKRRRLELQAPPESPVPQVGSQVASLSEAETWYMGPHKIIPSELFYPLNEDEDGESFVIASPRFPTAQSTFVNKRLNYFYQQQPVKLDRSHGRTHWAIVPYKSSSAVKDRKRWFTLYTSGDGSVTVSKEDLEKWPQLRDASDVIGTETSTDTVVTGSLEQSDPLACLLQKYPAEQDDQGAYPVFGDSGSEGEYDDDTWNEIQIDRHETKQDQPSRLTSAQVDSIIKNAIAGYEEQWQQNSLPHEEHKARRSWLSAKRKKISNQWIKELTHDIGLQERRLTNLQNHIREHQYTRAAELETQCQNMMQTVSNIQRQKWLVSVLEQTTCPPKLDPKPRQMPKPKEGENPDDEFLASESDGFLEGISDNESEDKFIDDSMVDEHAELDKPRHATPSSTAYDDKPIVPSQLRKNSNHQKAAVPAEDKNKAPSSLDPQNDRATHLIDLTRDSPAPDDLTIETPPINPVDSEVMAPPQSADEHTNRERRYSVSSMSDLDNDTNSETKPNPSSLNDLREVSLTPWDVVEKSQDRRWILAKLVASLDGDDERKGLAAYIFSEGILEVKSDAKKALKAIGRGLMVIPGLEDAGLNAVIMRIASLFTSWINVTPIMGAVSRHQNHKARKELNTIFVFSGELKNRLSAFGTWSQNPSGSVTQEPRPPQAHGTPHKKRKREVKESQDAKRNQESAQQRVALQDQQRKQLEQRMTNMGVSNNDPSRQAVSFGDPVIYLDPHIGQRVKPHQLRGIQFMWRELVEDEKHEGCLLAHTMGLGKTMQVISLLVTLSAAASSPDQRVREQVPGKLRASRTLVICPSQVIENWFEEFLMWTPQDCGLGLVRKVTRSMSFLKRLQEAFDWDEYGGVLIISYDIFRVLVNNTETKARKKPLEDESHQRIKECLLNGPNIVVADEAHKMKNRLSGISSAAKQFLTKSRIAMTGSPLANNLIDYFSMVDWIAPGYLGEKVDFKANFLEPIEEGLYSDSTYHERKKSRVKLQVLKEILDPKINRADITVLAGELPPKVEFVITIPLTELQKTAYNSYVESVVGKNEVRNTTLWSWLAILGLCCSHPACFKTKLLSRANDAPKTSRDDVEPVPGDESIAQAGLPEQLIPKEEELFATVPNINALELSYRIGMLIKIVNLSIEAGEKILIFSQSIPTLDFIEGVLKTFRHKYSRLDGQTPVQSRQFSTKQFNTGSEHQVYLISTRAGGLGLNIPGANRIVIFDFGFNPTHEEQAVGRAYRLGQQKTVYVYRFQAAGTFEEIIHNRAVFKTQLAFRVVDKKNTVRSAQKTAGDYLFPVKTVPKEELTEFVGKDPHVLDKIILDGGPILRIALTETFQKEDNEKLTEEDRKDVRTQLDDERLKRTDPVAYDRLMQQRQIEAINASRTAVQGETLSTPHLLQQYPPRPGAPPPYKNGYTPATNLGYLPLNSVHGPSDPTPTQTFHQGLGFFSQAADIGCGFQSGQLVRTGLPSSHTFSENPLRQPNPDANRDGPRAAQHDIDGHLAQQLQQDANGRNPT